MPKSCVAVGCHNHNMMMYKKMSFFTFPKDLDHCEKWINAVKRMNKDAQNGELIRRPVSVQNILYQVKHYKNELAHT